MNDNVSYNSVHVHQFGMTQVWQESQKSWDISPGGKTLGFGCDLSTSIYTSSTHITLCHEIVVVMFQISRQRSFLISHILENVNFVWELVRNNF